jgi:peptide/nickel transport system substrate-binding protein
MAVAASACTVLLLAGCAKSANSGSATVSSGTGVKAATVALASGGKTLDPVEAQDTTSDSLVLAAYDQLVAYKISGGKANSTEFAPSLATSWKTSSDGLTWTFKLRKDVKFAGSNDELTANDFVYTINRLKNSTSGSTLYKLSKISTAEAKDDNTLVLTLSEPNPILLQYLVQYSFSAEDSKFLADKDASKYLVTHTAGTGAYTIKSWDPATQADLVRNSGYWGTKPQLSPLTIKFIPEMSTQIQQLEKGDLKMITGIPLQNVADLQKDKNVRVVTNVSGRAFNLGMNTKVAPFDNVKVRQAINYAIPYDDIIKTALYGEGIRARSAIPSNMPGHDDSTDPYSHNLDKARSLLTEAGLGNGFSFTVQVRNDQTQAIDALTLIQAELKKINVTMTIQQSPSQQYLQMLDSGNAQAFVQGWLSFVNQPVYHLGFLLQSEGSANYANYSNPEVDALIAKAASADPGASKQIWKQVQQKISADAPWAYLFQANATYGLAKGLDGFVMYPDEMVRFGALKLK